MTKVLMNYMYRQQWRETTLLFLFLSLAMGAPADTIPSGCPLIKMEVERLPDLNIPRAGHQLFLANGEYVVAGGHTNGFIPTPTAEYFKDGEWHTMQMTYTHDFGFSVVLKSGKVLIGGGSSEPIGIGQTYLAEMYEPQSHSFYGFGSLDQKRTAASGLELDSGCVVIAGNWYHKDGIELFDGMKRFTYLKDVSAEHSRPHIFRTAKEDVVVFGGFDTKGDTLRHSMADKLRGEPVNIPLFDKWHPSCIINHRCAESFIGDASKDAYAYLFPVADSTGQVAIAKIENGDVTLLPTVCPVPMKSQWGGIEYYSTIVADQERGRAYLMGVNAELHTQPEKGFRNYILRIDYAKAVEGKPAPLTLYYTDPMQDSPDYTPILTPEGNLLMAGGLTTAASNFFPSRCAYVFHVGDNNDDRNLRSDSMILANIKRPVPLILAALAAAIVVAILFLIRRRRLHKGDRQAEVQAKTIVTSNAGLDRDLMSRINELMENEKPYLNSGLKVSDIADIFHLHRNTVSACINSQTGCTFAQYINRYRINYAKQMIRQQPEKKISSVWMESGFGSEQTFFKTFRAVTGLSPKEWIQQEND